MKTLNVTIKHEKKVEHDDMRLKALEDAFNKLIDWEEFDREIMNDYVYSHEKLIREICPEILALDVCGNFVLFEYYDKVAYCVVTPDMPRKEVTRKILETVKGGK